MGKSSMRKINLWIRRIWFVTECKISKTAIANLNTQYLLFVCLDVHFIFNQISVWQVNLLPNKAHVHCVVN